MRFTISCATSGIENIKFNNQIKTVPNILTMSPNRFKPTQNPWEKA